MGDYGLNVSNSGGELIIDGDYINHSIDELGSKTATYYSGGSDDVYYSMIADFNFNRTYNKPPLVGLRCTSHEVWVNTIKTDSNGNAYGVIVGAMRDAEVYDEASDVNFDYVVASEPDNITGGDFGLQVFNPSGEVVYDSGMYETRIIDARAINVPYWADYSEPTADSATLYDTRTSSQSHASGSNTFYAANQAAAAGLDYHDEQLRFGLRQTSSGSVQGRWLRLSYWKYAGGGEPFSQYADPLPYLVIEAG